MTHPLVSVVTAVHRRDHVEPSLASVLGQTLGDLELIVVDDGSSDGTADALSAIAARDPRVRNLRQDTRRGLTEALIVGCAAARGEFIARHDSDDLSLPPRLERQVELLRSDPSLVMAGCGTRAIGPGDETLFENSRPSDPDEATRSLRDELVGPGAHGSVMFRTESYRQVGGYRAPFRYAQDWDLWLRLLERGRVGYVPEILYAYRIAPDSVSGSRRQQQQQLVDLAARCREARRRGQPEQEWLQEALACSGQVGDPRPSGTDSYFIGRCLMDRRDRRAVGYLARSVSERPWSWRRWTALAGSLVVCRGIQETPS
jgi:glycosyltransferase involved in cell wall biosynthesis